MATLVATPQDPFHTDRSGPSLPHFGLTWTPEWVTGVYTTRRQHQPHCVQEQQLKLGGYMEGASTPHTYLWPPGIVLGITAGI